jgi:hypothetical protein
MPTSPSLPQATAKSSALCGKQRLQDLLGGLLAMRPDDFIADLIRSEHTIQQSFILGSLAEQQ